MKKIINWLSKYFVRTERFGRHVESSNIEIQQNSKSIHEIRLELGELSDRLKKQTKTIQFLEDQNLELRGQVKDLSDQRFLHDIESSENHFRG